LPAHGLVDHDCGTGLESLMPQQPMAKAFGCLTALPSTAERLRRESLCLYDAENNCELQSLHENYWLPGEASATPNERYRDVTPTNAEPRRKPVKICAPSHDPDGWRLTALEGQSIFWESLT
jgi:hypothetical protein